jgi:hypothetical protein
MDDETRNSLKRIIDYLYTDEERHWQESDPPEADHIFHDIMRVAKWLDSAAHNHHHATDMQRQTITRDGFARTP